MERLVKALLFDAVTVASTGSVTSNEVPLRSTVQVESLLILLTSAVGTPDVKIEYAISHNGVDFGSFDDYTDLVASSATEFVTDEGITAISLPNLLVPYAKFKVTGINANPADTLVTIRLLIRES